MSDTPDNPRVLVVDDDALARRMMRRALQRQGYDVLEAADGRAGLEIVRTKSVDAVLLDMRMPGELSGPDVARKLREDVRFRDLPIIVVSASVHAGARELVSGLGCDGFLEKPVVLTELHATLARMLDR